MDDITTAIPLLDITCKPTVSCFKCGTVSYFEATGFTLPQNEGDIKSSSVRFVLKSTSGIKNKKTFKCRCLREAILKRPIITLQRERNCMKIIKTNYVKDGKHNVGCWCCECGKPNHYLLEIGERPDWDSSTVQVCFDCINKALNVVKRQIPKKMRRVKE